jgi:hypothetical protein
MKILYITPPTEDYLSDGILYGLRRMYGPDVVDYPKKECMYVGNKDLVDYGGGFTLWGLLPDLNIDRDHVQEQVVQGYYDIIVFSDIYHLQEIYTFYNVYLILQKNKDMGKKFVFLDGSDDGKPAVTEAFNWGTYFKRDNPYGYPVKIIGLSIPECKIKTEQPIKTKLFARYCQVEEAYELQEVRTDCNTVRFTKEEEYYADIASSKYGLGMKKSGWDTPRTIEYAANWTVPCTLTKGWEWDGKGWDQKPVLEHPLGLVDMENCILWETSKELMDKINSIDDEKYNEMSKAAHDWALTKTCEKSAEYVINNI